jgi:hypothetical protein
VTGCYNPHYHARKGYIKWENQLLNDLAAASEMTDQGLRISIKSLAAAMGIKLPKWSDNKAEVNL